MSSSCRMSARTCTTVQPPVNKTKLSDCNTISNTRWPRPTRPAAAAPRSAPAVKPKALPSVIQSAESMALPLPRWPCPTHIQQLPHLCPHQHSKRIDFIADPAEHNENCSGSTMHISQPRAQQQIKEAHPGMWSCVHRQHEAQAHLRHQKRRAERHPITSAETMMGTCASGMVSQTLGGTSSSMKHRRAASSGNPLPCAGAAALTTCGIDKITLTMCSRSCCLWHKPPA